MTSGGWELESKYKDLKSKYMRLVRICKDVLECYIDGDDDEKLIIDGQLDDYHFEVMRKLERALSGEYNFEKKVGN